jgi:hypothetical protein
MTREVDAIVNNVNAQLDNPDKKAESKAYQMLADEVYHVASTQGQSAATDFASQALSQLDKDGKLPSLSVGWVRQNYDQINSYKDDGGISMGEVSRYANKSGSADALLQSVMADRLLQKDGNGASVFKDVATRSPNSLDDYLIEKCDLRAFGRQERREDRREAKHDSVREDAARLLEGSPPLMLVLDASGSGQVDGRVSERDMRRFLKQYDVNEQTQNAQQWPYTKDNAQYVSDLLDGKYPHITGSNFTGFSAEALTRRAGIDQVIVRHPSDYDILLQKFQKGADEKAAAPAEQPKKDNREAEEAKQHQEEEATKERQAAIEINAAKLTTEQIKDMGTFRKGDGYWHVSKRLLDAGFSGEDHASNTDIMKLTKLLVAANHSTIDAHGKPRPMVHPGDTINDFSPYIPAFSKQVPRLAQSMQQLFEANKQKLSEGEE